MTCLCRFIIAGFGVVEMPASWAATEAFALAITKQRKLATA